MLVLKAMRPPWAALLLITRAVLAHTAKCEPAEKCDHLVLRRFPEKFSGRNNYRSFSLLGDKRKSFRMLDRLNCQIDVKSRPVKSVRLRPLDFA